MMAQLFSWLVPPFIKKLDHWLLLNHPLVWRTRIVYFVFYGMLVYLLMYMIGSTVNIGLTTVPTASDINLWIFVISAIAFIIFLLWLMDQLQNPQVRRFRLKDFLLTTGLYGLCLSFLFLTPFFLLNPLIPKIADVMDDENFYAKYEFHQEHDFWEYTTDALLFLDSSFERRIVADYELLGLDVPVTVGYGDSNAVRSSYIWLCHQVLMNCESPDSLKVRTGKDTIALLPSLITNYRGSEQWDYYSIDTIYWEYSDDTKLTRKPGSRFYEARATNQEFKDKLYSIEQAKVFKEKDGNYYERLSFAGIMSWIVFFLFVGTVITVAQIRVRTSEQSLVSRVIALLKGIYYYDSNWSVPLRKIDKYLLLNWPVLWTWQVHRFYRLWGVIALALFAMTSIYLLKIIHTIFPFLKDEGNTIVIDSYWMVVSLITLLILVLLLVPNAKWYLKQRTINLTGLSVNKQVHAFWLKHIYIIPYCICLVLLIEWWVWKGASFDPQSEPPVILFVLFILLIYFGMTAVNYLELVKHVGRKSFVIYYFAFLILGILSIPIFFNTDLYFDYDLAWLSAISSLFSIMSISVRTRYVKLRLGLSNFISLSCILSFPFLQIVPIELIDILSDDKWGWYALEVFDSDNANANFVLRSLVMMLCGVVLFFAFTYYPMKSLIEGNSIYPRKVR